MFYEDQKYTTKIVASGKGRNIGGNHFNLFLDTFWSNTSSTKILRLGTLNDTGFLNQTEKNISKRHTCRIVQNNFGQSYIYFHIILIKALAFPIAPNKTRLSYL